MPDEDASLTEPDRELDYTREMAWETQARRRNTVVIASIVLLVTVGFGVFFGPVIR